MGSGMQINIFNNLSFLIGAFGEVRMCQHRKIRVVRAVKILKKSALDAKDVERFIHEIDILKTMVSSSYF